MPISAWEWAKTDKKSVITVKSSKVKATVISRGNTSLFFRQKTALTVACCCGPRQVQPSAWLGLHWWQPQSPTLKPEDCYLLWDGSRHPQHLQGHSPTSRSTQCRGCDGQQGPRICQHPLPREILQPVLVSRLRQRPGTWNGRVQSQRKGVYSHILGQAVLC